MVTEKIMNPLCVTCTFFTMMTHTRSAHKAHLSWPNAADCMSLNGTPCFLTYLTMALNVLSMPASQAYAEHVFSVCGYLSAGRRNRLLTNIGCTDISDPGHFGPKTLRT